MTIDSAYIPECVVCEDDGETNCVYCHAPLCVRVSCDAIHRAQKHSNRAREPYLGHRDREGRD